MDPKNRVAIIVQSRLKPDGKGPMMRKADPMQSSDFDQEVDEDSDVDVELETYAEDLISGVKLHDAAKVVEAFKQMFECMSHHEETESPEEKAAEDEV